MQTGISWSCCLWPNCDSLFIYVLFLFLFFCLFFFTIFCMSSSASFICWSSFGADVHRLLGRCYLWPSTILPWTLQRITELLAGPGLYVRHWVCLFAEIAFDLFLCILLFHLIWLGRAIGCCPFSLSAWAFSWCRCRCRCRSVCQPIPCNQWAITLTCACVCKIWWGVL